MQKVIAKDPSSSSEDAVYDSEKDEIKARGCFTTSKARNLY